MRLTTTFTGLMAAALAACGGDPAPAPTPQAETRPPAADATPSAERPYALDSRFDAEGIFHPNPRFAPAHQRNRTLAAFKADQFHDYRLAAPQYFAITEPPALTDFRPMVEWEPMRAIVMTFPSYNLSSANITNTFVQIGRHAITAGEVWYFIDNSNVEGTVRTRLLEAGVDQQELDNKVKFLLHDFDTVWFVDFGPLPLIDRTSNTFAFADFRYYHDRVQDDAMATVLARRMSGFGYEATTTTYRMPLTTEGGTIQSTSDGICLTSDRQLYYMSCEKVSGCQPDIESLPLADLQKHPLAVEMREILRAYAGCVDLIVLYAVTDDGTGHLDMFLKILDDNRVLISEYVEPFDNDSQALNAQRLDDDADFLEAWVKPDGSSFSVHRLVMPGHRSSIFGVVPFTYINATFFNGLNLWPVTGFADWEDRRQLADSQWQDALPDMTHIPIDATELSFNSGAIHCITRTIPAIEAGVWVPDGECVDGSCQTDEGGYAGACVPGATDEEVCWGPDWECECNDCDTSCESGPDACGGITFRGCCEDDTTLLYCESQQLFQVDCQGSCGWEDGAGWYNCEQRGADPEGKFKRACDGAECSCDGRECGDDGCGGACGKCEPGVACIEGVCRAECAACELGTIGCDGTVAWLCTAGLACNQLNRVDCADSGRACLDGDCVAPRPAEDVVGGDSDSPDAGAPSSDTDSLARRSDSGGCGAGPGTTPWWFVIVMSLALRLAGRAGWRARRRYPRPSGR